MANITVAAAAVATAGPKESQSIFHGYEVTFFRSALGHVSLDILVLILFLVFSENEIDIG